MPASPTTATSSSRRLPSILLFVAAGVLAVATARLVAPDSQTPVPSADQRQTAQGSPAIPKRGVGIGHHASRGTGIADGAVPEGVTVFDDGYPAVANLDTDLLAALRQAATDARADGVRMVVNSGWRSAAYQERLLDLAVEQYGSRAEAARWVATPETSLHVSGDAVDLGPSEADEWLRARGAAYGLCQVYANEPWHYELRPDAAADGCPEMYADPAHDPRMGAR